MGKSMIRVMYKNYRKINCQITISLWLGYVSAMLAVGDGDFQVTNALAVRPMTLYNSSYV